jgi:hypothetical protein
MTQTKETFITQSRKAAKTQRRRAFLIFFSLRLRAFA